MTTGREAVRRRIQLWPPTRMKLTKGQFHERRTNAVHVRRTNAATIPIDVPVFDQPLKAERDCQISIWHRLGH
jgi:hypothetical protein